MGKPSILHFHLVSHFELQKKRKAVAEDDDEMNLDEQTDKSAADYIDVSKQKLQTGTSK